MQQLVLITSQNYAYKLPSTWKLHYTGLKLPH